MRRHFNNSKTVASVSSSFFINIFIILLPFISAVSMIIAFRNSKPILKSTLLHSPSCRTNKSSSPFHEFGIIASCPFLSNSWRNNNNGQWKPKNPAYGIETIIKQLIFLSSTSLPFYFSYYHHEQMKTEPYCKLLQKKYRSQIKIYCFLIKEKYPVGKYGYGKIFAIKEVPINQLIWLDCDMFPLQDLRKLFSTKEYNNTGSLFWPDSRDHFDEYQIETVLNSSGSTDLMFSIDSWYVKQGFDTGIFLLNRKLCERQLNTLYIIAKSGKVHKVIQDLSMGDKDLFHIAWMIHNRMFGMIPYIGETGIIERVFTPKHKNEFELRWKMSSQIKYGFNGEIYGLHQLHRLHRLKYIIPSHIVRQDLRHIKKLRDNEMNCRINGYLQDDVQHIINMEKRKKKIIRRISQRTWVTKMNHDETSFFERILFKINRDWRMDHVRNVDRSVIEEEAKRIVADLKFSA